MGSQCCKCANDDKQHRGSVSSVYRFRGDVPMPSDRYQIQTRGNIVQLTLNKSQKEDTGHYALVAKKLSTGLSISGDDRLESRHKIRLSIQDPSSVIDEGEPPIFVRRLSDLAVKVGTRTRFLVEIRSSTSPKVTWHKNDEPVQSGSRFSFVHEGNFYCVDVAPVMVDDQGHWTCMAENGGGRSSCTSFLTVIVPKAYKKPEFVEELRALLTETGTVSLECKVVGVPTPVLKWFKDQKEIKAGDVFALTANPDDPTSLGTYTCEAVNCMGSTCSSSRVHVMGKGSREGSLRPADALTPSGPLPVFEKILRDESCRIGDSLVLSCQVQVPPWPKSITWYNKEGRVEPSEKYHIKADGLGGYSIEIKVVEAMDEGEWKCVATSIENVKQFSTCHVAMSIPKNYRVPRFMESLKAVLTEEGLVSFECKVVGFPTPLLRWFKDGQELHPGDVYQLTGTNSLGSYCCIAKNCMGEAKSIAELTVEDIQNQLNDEERMQLMSWNQAPKFIKGLRSCEARINEDFTFTIQVSVLPEPCLSWYRDDVLIIESEKYRLAKQALGTCNLEVKKLEFMDQAEWKCVATNDFGHSITSCFLKLVIPKHFKKPKFLESLRAILSEEGAVNLECKVIGVPQPLLKWYKDGVELKPGDIHRIISGQDGTCCLGTYTCEATNCMGSVSSSASLLGFEDRVSVRKEEAKEPATPLHELARNLSLSTIHEERTSQLYDTPQTDHSITMDDRGEVSFSFDGKEVSVSLYETPDLTEEEALQIVEMYADQLSEHITEGNIIELPPMRFTKETSTTGNLLMEAVVIDVSPDYFVPDDEGDDLRTEADVEDVSIMDDQMHSLRSLSYVSSPTAETPGDRVPSGSPPSRPPRRKESRESFSSRSERSEKSLPRPYDWSESYHSAKEPSIQAQLSSLQGQDDSVEAFTDALSFSGAGRSKADEYRDISASLIQQNLEKILLDETAANSVEKHNSQMTMATQIGEALVEEIPVKRRKKKKDKSSRTPSLSSKASSEESYSLDIEENGKRRSSKNGKDRERRGSAGSNKSSKGRRSRSGSESGKFESAVSADYRRRESDATIMVDDFKIEQIEEVNHQHSKIEMANASEDKEIEERPDSTTMGISSIDSEKSMSKTNKERLLDNVYKLTEPVMSLRNALVDVDVLLPLLQTQGSPADVERSQIEIAERIVVPVENLCEQVSAIETKALKSAGDRSLAQNVRISLLEAIGGPTEELLRGIELIRRHSGQQDPKSNLIVLESLADPVDEILVGLTRIEHELISHGSAESSFIQLEKPIALERMHRGVSRLGENVTSINERKIVFGDESTSCSVIERLQSVYQSLEAFLSTVPLSETSGALENNVDTLVVETLVRPLEELSRNLCGFGATSQQTPNERETVMVNLEKSMMEMRTRLEALTIALETYEKESGEEGITDLHADLVKFLRYTMDDAIERLEKLKLKKKRVTQETIAAMIIDGKSSAEEDKFAIESTAESSEIEESNVSDELAQEKASILEKTTSIAKAEIIETKSPLVEKSREAKSDVASSDVEDASSSMRDEEKASAMGKVIPEVSGEFSEVKKKERKLPELDSTLSLPEMLLDPLIDVQANLNDVISDFESQESADEAPLPSGSELAACLSELRESVATAAHKATTLKSTSIVNALVDLREPLLDLQLAMASAVSPEEIKLIREATVPLAELKVIVNATVESPQISEASQIQMKSVLRMLEDIEAEVSKVEVPEIVPSISRSETQETESLLVRPPEEIDRAAVALTGVHFVLSTALERATRAKSAESSTLQVIKTHKGIAENLAASNLIASIEELRQSVGNLAVSIGTPVKATIEEKSYNYEIVLDELAKLEEPLLNLQKVLLTEKHGSEDRHVLNDLANPIRSLKEVVKDVTSVIDVDSTPIILELIEDVEKDVTLIAMEALKKALAAKSEISDDDDRASISSSSKPGDVSAIITKWLDPVEDWLTSAAEETIDIEESHVETTIAPAVDDFKRELLKIAIQTSYSEPPSDAALIEALTELQEPLARLCAVLNECHEPENLSIVEGLVQPTKHLLGTILDASLVHEAGKVLRPVLEAIEELENQIPLTIKRVTYERELQRVVRSMTPEEPETLIAEKIPDIGGSGQTASFDQSNLDEALIETSGKMAIGTSEFDKAIDEKLEILSQDSMSLRENVEAVKIVTTVEERAETSTVSAKQGIVREADKERSEKSEEKNLAATDEKLSRSAESEPTVEDFRTDSKQESSEKKIAVDEKLPESKESASEISTAERADQEKSVKGEGSRIDECCSETKKEEESAKPVESETFPISETVEVITVDNRPFSETITSLDSAQTAEKSASDTSRADQLDLWTLTLLGPLDRLGNAVLSLDRSIDESAHNLLCRPLDYLHKQIEIAESQFNRPAGQSLDNDVETIIEGFLAPVNQLHSALVAAVEVWNTETPRPIVKELLTSIADSSTELCELLNNLRQKLIVQRAEQSLQEQQEDASLVETINAVIAPLDNVRNLIEEALKGLQFVDSGVELQSDESLDKRHEEGIEGAGIIGGGETMQKSRGVKSLEEKRKSIADSELAKASVTKTETLSAVDNEETLIVEKLESALGRDEKLGEMSMAKEVIEQSVEEKASTSKSEAKALRRGSKVKEDSLDIEETTAKPLEELIEAIVDSSVSRHDSSSPKDYKSMTPDVSEENIEKSGTLIGQEVIGEEVIDLEKNQVDNMNKGEARILEAENLSRVEMIVGPEITESARQVVTDILAEASQAESAELSQTEQKLEALKQAEASKVDIQEKSLGDRLAEDLREEKATLLTEESLAKAEANTQKSLMLESSRVSRENVPEEEFGEIVGEKSSQEQAQLREGESFVEAQTMDTPVMKMKAADEKLSELESNVDEESLRDISDGKIEQEKAELREVEALAKAAVSDAPEMKIKAIDAKSSELESEVEDESLRDISIAKMEHEKAELREVEALAKAGVSDAPEMKIKAIDAKSSELESEVEDESLRDISIAKMEHEKAELRKVEALAKAGIIDAPEMKIKAIDAKSSELESEVEEESLRDIYIAKMEQEKAELRDVEALARAGVSDAPEMKIKAIDAKSSELESEVEEESLRDISIAKMEQEKAELREVEALARAGSSDAPEMKIKAIDAKSSELESEVEEESLRDISIAKMEQEKAELREVEALARAGVSDAPEMKIKAIDAKSSELESEVEDESLRDISIAKMEQEKAELREVEALAKAGVSDAPEMKIKAIDAKSSELESEVEDESLRDISIAKMEHEKAELREVEALAKAGVSDAPEMKIKAIDAKSSELGSEVEDESLRDISIAKMEHEKAELREVEALAKAGIIDAPEMKIKAIDAKSSELESEVEEESLRDISIAKMEQEKAELRDVEALARAGVSDAPEMKIKAIEAKSSELESEVEDESLRDISIAKMEQEKAELREVEALAKAGVSDAPEMKIKAIGAESSELESEVEESLRDISIAKMEQEKAELREVEPLAKAGVSDAPEMKVKAIDAKSSELESEVEEESLRDIYIAKMEQEKAELREVEALAKAGISDAPEMKIKAIDAKSSELESEVEEESLRDISSEKMKHHRAELGEEESFATVEVSDVPKMRLLEKSETAEVSEKNVQELLVRKLEHQEADLRQAESLLKVGVTDTPEIIMKGSESEVSETSREVTEESVREISEEKLQKQKAELLDSEILATASTSVQKSLQAGKMGASETAEIVKEGLQTMSKDPSQTAKASIAIGELRHTAEIAKIEAIETAKMKEEQIIEAAESAIIEIVETPTEKIFKMRKEGTQKDKPEEIVQKIVLKPVEEIVAMEDQNIIQIVETPSEKVIKMKIAVEGKDGILEEVIEEIIVKKPIEGWAKSLVEEEHHALFASKDKIQEFATANISPEEQADTKVEIKQREETDIEDGMRKDKAERLETRPEEVEKIKIKEDEKLRKEESDKLEKEKSECARREEEEQLKKEQAENLEKEKLERARQEEDERLRKEKAESFEKEESERNKIEAEKLKREEHERAKKEEEDRLKKEETERLEKEELESKKREAEKFEQEELERTKKEKEKDQLKKEEVERLEKEELERKKREAEELKQEELERAKKEEDRIKKEEAERLEKEELERKKQEAEKLKQEELERAKKEEDRIKKEETERLEKEELERKKREAEKLKQEELERAKKEKEDRIKKEEVERLEKEELERKKQEAEKLKKEELDRAKKEEDRIKKEEAEHLEKEELEHKKQEAEKLKQEGLERAKKEEDRIKKEEAERLEKEELERKKQEAEKLKQEELERAKKEEEDRIKKEEAEHLEKEELDRKKQEAEKLKQEELERAKKEEGDRIKKEEAERLQKEELERKKREAEKLKQEKLERAQKEEEDRIKKEEAERLEKEELDRKKQEAEKLKQEELERAKKEDRVKKEEAERLEKEELERKKQEAEKLKQEELERAKKEEEDRIKKEEAERLEKEKLERKKQEAEKLKQEELKRAKKEEVRIKKEEAERLEKEELERKKQEAEKLKQEELERAKKEEEDRIKKEEAERLEKEELECKKQEAERLKQEKLERAKKEEGDRIKKEEAERLQKEELERKKREAEKLKQEELERAKKEEEDRIKKEEAERLEKEELERKKQEAEKLKQEELERAKKEEDRIKKEEAERLQKEELERKKREAEKLKQEELERAKKQEEDRIKKEEAESLEKEELDRKKREAEKLKQEELERAKKEAMDRLQKEEAERLEKEELERKKREAEKLKQEELERAKEEEADRLKKEEADRLEKEELERKKRDAEKLKQEELERAKKEEEDRLERENAEKMKQKELERQKQEDKRKKQEELERAKKEEEERLKKEESARLEKEELERLKKEEAAKLENEKLEKQKMDAERLKKEETVKLENENLEMEEAQRLKKDEDDKVKKDEEQKEKIQNLEKQESKGKETKPLKKKDSKDESRRSSKADDTKEESGRLKREDSKVESRRSSKKEDSNEESEGLKRKDSKVDSRRSLKTEDSKKESKELKRKDSKVDSRRSSKTENTKEEPKELKKKDSNVESRRSSKKEDPKEESEGLKKKDSKVGSRRSSKKEDSKEESEGIKKKASKLESRRSSKKEDSEESEGFKTKDSNGESPQSTKKQDSEELNGKDSGLECRKSSKKDESKNESEELQSKDSKKESKTLKKKDSQVESRRSSKKEDSKDESKPLKKTDSIEESSRFKRESKMEEKSESLNKEDLKNEQKQPSKKLEDKILLKEEGKSKIEKQDVEEDDEKTQTIMEQEPREKSNQRHVRLQEETSSDREPRSSSTIRTDSEMDSEYSETSKSLRDQAVPEKSRRKRSSHEIGMEGDYEPSKERRETDRPFLKTRNETFSSDDRHYTPHYSATSRIHEFTPGPRDRGKKPSFCTKLTDRTAAESSRIKLTCTVLGDPEPLVYWTKDGKELASSSNRHCIIEDNGMVSLELYAAAPKDSGEYSCVAKNVHGQSYTEAKLKVYAGYEPLPALPTFTRSIKDTYHYADNELVLECRVRGQPSPKITWLKDGQILQIRDRYQQCDLGDGICRLKISHPDFYDSGLYTCRAENDTKISDCTSHVVNFDGKGTDHSASWRGSYRNLTSSDRDTGRPKFSSFLTDHNVPAGGTIALQVEVKGVPPPDITWLRGDKREPISAYKARTFADSGVYTLIVPEATESETGTYVCRASNAYGYVDTAANVEVISSSSSEGGKPAMFVSRPAETMIHVTVGEDVSVSFRVCGVPKPRIVWMKGLRDITNGPKSYKESSDDYVRLTLKRAAVSDEGTYCIMAKNRYGCDRTFYTVKVKQRARSLTPSQEWATADTDNLLANIHDTERSYLKQVPGPITSEPVIVDGGRNWLALTWGKAVQHGPAPVVAYRVDAWLLGGEGGARWAELGITPVNAFDAFNLRPGGEYKFRITPRNRYGWGDPVTMTNSVTVREVVKFPEFTKIYPGQLKALRGETLNLECEVRSESKAEVKWYRDTTDIDSIRDSRYMTYYNGSKCTMTVQSIKDNDSGRYVCEATNPAGRVSTFARVQVVTDPKIVEADEKLRRMRTLEPNNKERPPEFTMRLRDRRVQMTYPVRLTCQVSGHPEPEVTWYKNREEIFQDENVSFWDDESHFHTLEISHSSVEDSGVYMAKARNFNGSVSCRCHLVVDKGIRAYVAPEFFRHLDAVYTVKAGSELRMSAQIEAYPTVGVVWHRDGHRLRPSRSAVMTLNHDGSVELSLGNVTTRDAGLYCCTATNEVGQAESTARITVIGSTDEEPSSISQSLPDVVESLDVPYSKEPLFVTKPLSTEAIEGDTVIILCEVVGDPKPEVIWLRDFLRPDYYRDAPHFRRVGAGPQYRLEIPYAKLDFTGAYSVIAKNCHGEAKAIISLQIYARGQGKSDGSMDHATIKHGNVQTLPSIKRPLRDLRCCDGDAVTLICKVYATPEPDIRWEKSGKLLPLGDDFVADFDGETARLSIQHVYPEDEGEYTCVAYNDLGKAFTSACLIVDVPEGKESAISRRLIRPIGLLSAESTPISTPRSTPIRSLSPSCAGNRRELKPATRPPRGQSVGRRPRLPIGPKFYAVPHNRVAEEGETVRFQCAIAGHPTPWVTWDKDGVPVTPTARITLKEKDDVRILEITEINHEDAGLYRIMLENDVGRTEATARLEIIKGRHSSVSRTVRTRSASPRTYSIYSRSPITSAIRGDTHLRPNPRDTIRGGTLSPTLPRWHQRNGKPSIESPEPARRMNNQPARTIIKNGTMSAKKLQNPKIPIPAKPRSSSAPGQNPSSRGISPTNGNTRQMKTSPGQRITIDVNNRTMKNTRTTTTTTTNGSMIPKILPMSRSRSPKGMEIITTENPRDSKDFVNREKREKLQISEVSKDNVVQVKYEKTIVPPTLKIDNDESPQINQIPLELSPITRNEIQMENSRFIVNDTKECRPPTILAAPADVIAVRGSKVILLATFDGEPQPRVRWLRKGRDVRFDDKAEIETSRGLTCLTLEDVNTEQTGKYAVTLENIAGRDCRYVNVTVEGVPDPPAGTPCVQSITRSGKAIVTWRSPPYDGGCVVTGYSVEMKRADEPSWIAVAEARHSLSHTVTGLQPEDTYQFRVRAENAHGVSEPSAISDTVTVPGENDEEIGGQVFTAEINQIEIEEEEEEFEPAFEARIVTPEEGHHFQERFQVLEELGKGRYGIVRRILEKSTGLNLAAKFIRTIKAKDREQVHDEIGIMNRLRHPKLLRLAAAFESPKEIIMVTEYISGGELFERVVADDFTLTEKDSIQFVKQICEGVEYMHAQSVVHLDLKPENIMCHTRTSHRIKLIDFGLAQTLKPDTPIRVLFGTPEFIPPEIIGFEPIGTESDMWSVGVICYVLLTGLSPFMGDNDVETFANITRADYDFDDVSFTAISQEAKDFISSLLIKRKELRMSAKKCLDHPWLAQQTESMSRVALPTEKLKKFIVRRKWQKTGNAIRALGRMAILSANTRRSLSTDSSPTKSEFGDELFADVTGNIHGFKPIQPIILGEDRTSVEDREKLSEKTDEESTIVDEKNEEPLNEISTEPEVEKVPEVEDKNGSYTDSITFTELEDIRDYDSNEIEETAPLIQEIDDFIKNDKIINDYSARELCIEELSSEICTDNVITTDLDSSVTTNSSITEMSRKPSFSSFANLEIKEECETEDFDEETREENILCERTDEEENKEEKAYDEGKDEVFAELKDNEEKEKIGDFKNNLDDVAEEENSTSSTPVVTKAWSKTNNSMLVDEEDEIARLTGRSHPRHTVRTGSVSRTAKMFERDDETRSSSMREHENPLNRTTPMVPEARPQNERIRKAFAFWNQ